MIKNLAHKNFLVIDHFLNQEQIKNVLDEFIHLESLKKFKPASVGKDAQKTLDQTIRSDEILWVDFESDNFKIAQQVIKPALDLIINEANQKLFLGIQSFEGHYAYYKAGSFYSKHIDTFSKDDSRILSFVLYLNQNWQDGDGGELCIYDPSREHKVIIEPQAGKLVLFLSHVLEHEVLVSHKPRRSFTGWFKKNQYLTLSSFSFHR